MQIDEYVFVRCHKFYRSRSTRKAANPPAIGRRSSDRPIANVQRIINVIINMWRRMRARFAVAVTASLTSIARRPHAHMREHPGLAVHIAWRGWIAAQPHAPQHLHSEMHALACDAGLKCINCINSAALHRPSIDITFHSGLFAARLDRRYIIYDLQLATYVCKSVRSREETRKRIRANTICRICCSLPVPRRCSNAPIAS